MLATHTVHRSKLQPTRDAREATLRAERRIVGVVKEAGRPSPHPRIVRCGSSGNHCAESCDLGSLLSSLDGELVARLAQDGYAAVRCPVLRLLLSCGSEAVRANNHC
jgi:hypothetical protein